MGLPVYGVLPAPAVHDAPMPTSRGLTPGVVVEVVDVDVVVDDVVVLVDVVVDVEVVVVGIVVDVVDVVVVLVDVVGADVVVVVPVEVTVA